MEEIKISAKGQELTLYMVEHFLTRLDTRIPGVKLSDLPEIIRTSYYIDRRPNQLFHLLKHGVKASYYMWNKPKGVVMVVEENENTRKVNVLKTAYKAKTCFWIHDWAKKHPFKTWKFVGDVIKELKDL